MGGMPADKCRSEALFLTENARSSAISTIIPSRVERLRPEFFSRRALTRCRANFRRSIMSHIAERLQAVRLRIAHAAAKAQRSPEDIDLLAVSKTFSSDNIAAAVAAGQRAFG